MYEGRFVLFYFLKERLNLLRQQRGRFGDRPRRGWEVFGFRGPSAAGESAARHFYLSLASPHRFSSSTTCMALNGGYIFCAREKKRKECRLKIIEVHSQQNSRFVLVLISIFIHSGTGVRTSKCPCCDASLLHRR